MIAKAVIKRNFSRYARHYDRYAQVQQCAGDTLLTRLEGHCFERILEIGCGTGHLTCTLQQHFPQAAIHAVDLSPDMIAVAQNKPFSKTVTYQVADVENTDLGGPYDLIVSNATFQWLSDIPATLARCRSCLGADGLLLFSLFGPDTYRELATVLREVRHATVTAASAFRLTKDSTARLLRQHFHEVAVDGRLMPVVYPDVLTLLRTIKYTGTQGEGLPGHTLLRGDIQALETVYRRRYDSIVATHEIVYAWARKAKTV